MTVAGAGLLLGPCVVACAALRDCPAVSPAAPAPSAAEAEAGETDLTVVAWAPREVVRRVNHRIDFGPYAAEIDATDGGRIVEFSRDGRSVVLPRDESPSAHGSSFWPSPQRDWGWPPPAAFDGKAWAARVEGAALLLESMVDPQLGLAARKRVEADVRREGLRLDYTLINRATTPRRVAPWQNTRVRPCGLTFYPSSGPNYPFSSLPLTPEAGIVWYRHDPKAHPESVKSFADGEEGWVAHVDGDLLFVKVFPDIPRERQAPEEGEVVIYVHGSGTFVEVEQQGAYEELSPGGSSSWTVHWFVRRLPPTLVVAPGEKTLVALARDLAAEARSVD